MAKKTKRGQRKSTSPTAKSGARPTIRQIAEDLGVSVSTVSRVLNGKGSEYRIALETQKRVKNAAAKVGFSPNLLARGLRLCSSETIGLVVPDIANPFFARIARDVTEVARQHGFSLLLCDSRDDTLAEATEIRLLQDRSVEGLIICPVGLSAEHLKPFETAPLTMVVVDRYFPELNLPTVGCDNVASARKAVCHLLEHGHRRIACLRGLAGTLSSEDRVEGYRRALEEEGIPYDETIVLGYGFSKKSGYESVLRLIEQKADITAIFATSNPSALGALRAIAEAGKKVPDDFSIVSFDDIDDAEFMRTPLTVVAQPVSAMGRRAAEVLFSQINGQKPAKSSPIMLPTRLITRDSVHSIG